MPGKDNNSSDPTVVNLHEKALMIRPTAWWRRANLLVTLRILSFTSILTVATLLIHLFLFPLLGIRESFLLFLPSVAFISWYMGFRAGIFMTVISALTITYFLLPEQYSWVQTSGGYISVLLYMLSAHAVNFLIEKSKTPDIVKSFIKREKEYQELVLKLHADYMNAKSEIRARDEFLSIASHELKTPLTAMLIQLQTVLHNIRNVSLANFSVEHLLKMLDSAEQQSKRLSKMINDLLNVSLITTGRMDLEKESMNLTKVVQECVDRFLSKTEKDEPGIEFRAEANVNGTFDKLRIEQAVINLLTNAVKYGNGSPVTVIVGKSGNTAKITVRDHGIGIPEAMQKKIFTRFERAVTKHSFEGLGVGLYITEQIVKAHGGKIELKSKEGKGSTFVLCLPIK